VDGVGTIGAGSMTKKTRQWLAPIGIVMILSNHITSADMHGGSHYFWPNYLALALGTSLLLGSLLAYCQQDK
jgi:hypothetical protein